jgi:hypothetical protein
MDQDSIDMNAQRKNQETAHIATNPQLIMNKGRFDEESAEYLQFKRQNIMKWGIISQLL